MNLVDRYRKAYSFEACGHLIKTDKKDLYEQIKDGICPCCLSPLVVLTQDMYHLPGDGRPPYKGPQNIIQCNDVDDCGLGYLLDEKYWIDL